MRLRTFCKLLNYTADTRYVCVCVCVCVYIYMYIYIYIYIYIYMVSCICYSHIISDMTLKL